MGFMDKVKKAAADVATEAKKATAQAQTKIEETQTRKKMNELAQQLGWLLYAERTQGTPVGAEGDRLVSEIGALQAQLDAQAAAAPETPADPAPETPADPEG